MDIQHDCDRVVREALTEKNPYRQAATLLQWIIDRGRDGSLEIVPPLNIGLGIRRPEEEEKV